MRQIWKTALASLCLIGFAGVVTGAALDASPSTVDARALGCEMMADAQYRLALDLRR